MTHKRTQGMPRVLSWVMHKTKIHFQNRCVCVGCQLNILSQQLTWLGWRPLNKVIWVFGHDPQTLGVPTQNTKSTEWPNTPLNKVIWVFGHETLGVPTQHTKSTVTKHSDYFVQRTRQSASRWLDALTKPVDKTRVNSCAFKNKIREFSNKKQSRFETARRAGLINLSIH